MNLLHPGSPYSGWKQSGLGVEGGVEQAESFTNLKSVWINTGAQAPALRRSPTLRPTPGPSGGLLIGWPAGVVTRLSRASVLTSDTVLADGCGRVRRAPRGAKEMRGQMAEANDALAGIQHRTIDLDVLREVEQRVLWLSTRMIDSANRRDGGEIKVGGHQASCASMVSIMTALWFGHIGGADKVAVKPHAAPVYHAIKYLTGELDRSYLTKLRQRGGLQAYPSRTKDPDVSDFSTGSVGLGAVAPLFSALTRRYVEAHFGSLPPARFIATVGDAELDEGNVWEAIADPSTHGLGAVTLIVDLNRQSLDRVVPDIQATRLKSFFADAGWHVAEAKYGSRLTAAFSAHDGEALRVHIDAMSNEGYQSIFGLEGPEMRDKFLAGADPVVVSLANDYSDAELKALVTDLGGHDQELLLKIFQSCDTEHYRPSVVFAYTIKGWGLPIAGDPLNHAALLTEEQIEAVRERVGLTADTEWDRFDSESAAGRLCAKVGQSINNPAPVPRPRPQVPAMASSPILKGSLSTQETFGRVLTRLGGIDDIRTRLVTAAPDVSISTNLGGWINKTGVFSHDERDDHGGADRLLKWAPSPEGQHIELGISEMNLFMLLGQLGLSHDHHGHMLLPIGTVYDPFVLRGLDALIYGLYNGSRFIVVGTPSGVTLAPEGGAHQSTVTASVESNYLVSTMRSPPMRPRSTGSCAMVSTGYQRQTARVSTYACQHVPSTRRHSRRHSAVMARLGFVDMFLLAATGSSKALSPIDPASPL